MQKPSRKTLVFLLLGAMAVLLLLWLVLREPQQIATLARVTRGPIEVSFVEEGKTRLQQRYVVTAPVAGMVRRIVLQPGDRVQAGQVVAEIDPAASGLLDARSRSQAQAELRGAEAALAAAEEDMPICNAQIVVELIPQGQKWMVLFVQVTIILLLFLLLKTKTWCQTTVLATLLLRYLLQK